VIAPNLMTEAIEGAAVDVLRHTVGHFRCDLFVEGDGQDGASKHLGKLDEGAGFSRPCKRFDDEVVVGVASFGEDFELLVGPLFGHGDSLSGLLKEGEAADKDCKAKAGGA
jgi:hypothetical protein